LMSPWFYHCLEAFVWRVSRDSRRGIQPSPAPDAGSPRRSPSTKIPGHLVAVLQVRYPQAGDLRQNDPYAYLLFRGLNRANQGILEFVEMFKAPLNEACIRC